jgi:hypothetical protein
MHDHMNVKFFLTLRFCGTANRLLHQVFNFESQYSAVHGLWALEKLWELWRMGILGVAKWVRVGA